MKLEITVAYSGQRVVNNGGDHPMYEVITNGEPRLCLSIGDVTDHVTNVIVENSREILHGKSNT